jgi:hypothetical protein
MPAMLGISVNIVPPGRRNEAFADSAARSSEKCSTTPKESTRSNSFSRSGGGSKHVREADFRLDMVVSQSGGESLTPGVRVIETCEANVRKALGKHGQPRGVACTDLKSAAAVGSQWGHPREDLGIAVRPPVIESDCRLALECIGVVPIGFFRESIHFRSVVQQVFD